MIPPFLLPYLTLFLGSLQNALLDCAFTDQPVHSDLLCLPQAVGPIHGLLVYSGVPVTIVENHLHRPDENTTKMMHSECRTDILRAVQSLICLSVNTDASQVRVFFFPPIIYVMIRK